MCRPRSGSRYKVPGSADSDIHTRVKIVHSHYHVEACPSHLCTISHHIYVCMDSHLRYSVQPESDPQRRVYNDFNRTHMQCKGMKHVYPIAFFKLNLEARKYVYCSSYNSLALLMNPTHPWRTSELHTTVCGPIRLN